VGATKVHSSKDRNAEFEAITLPNLKALRRKARYLLKDPGAADDVVQETCLQGWQHFDQFTLGTNGRAWLFAILRNVVKHEYRRRWRWQIDPQSLEILKNCAAPTGAYTEAFTDRHLLGAIDGMPLHLRQVLRLAVVSELRYHEIAEALQIPIGTVMSRLSRARSHLRSQFTASSGMRGTI
jgi:RNA polymerase sigma-70 factor (ECF subfamily)